MTEVSKMSRAQIVALVLLPIVGIALIFATIWLVKPEEKAVIEKVSTDAAHINTGEVIDATIPGARVAARVGYRYKIFLDDESDDRSSGVGRIGGLITFVPEAKRGQTVIADVTRVRERVADAVLVQVVADQKLPPKVKESYVPPEGDATANVVPGAEFDVVISEASSKNPDTEGVTRIKGLIVFVQGATTIGERVNVRITDRAERMAFAELTGKAAGEAPLASGGPQARRPRDDAPRSYTPNADDPAGHVVPGAVLRLKIVEDSKNNPGKEGVARVRGLVVFVKGATTIGETVNVRITERRERAASGEVTTDEPTVKDKPAAFSKKPAKASGPQADKDIPEVGAVITLTIEKDSDQNPGHEGIAFLNGRRIVVEGTVAVGQTVKARITKNLRSVSFADVVAE